MHCTLIVWHDQTRGAASAAGRAPLLPLLPPPPRGGCVHACLEAVLGERLAGAGRKLLQAVGRRDHTRPAAGGGQGA
jgi:hypothetical protein